MTSFHERYKAGKINTPVQTIEKQQQALQKIGRYMSVLQNLVNASFAASQLLKKDFIASEHVQIQQIIKECYKTAKVHGVDFYLNISDYNYINPEKDATKPFGIPSDLESEDWNPEEHGTDLESGSDYAYAYGEEREWLPSSC